jgi:hypothetical protein
MIDGANSIVAKERGKYPLQDFTISEHVGNATGNPQVVFENREAPIGQARQIGATEAYINIARDAEAAHLSAKVAAAVDKRARDNPRGEDSAVVVDILKE